MIMYKLSIDLNKLNPVVHSELMEGETLSHTYVHTVYLILTLI